MKKMVYLFLLLITLISAQVLPAHAYNNRDYNMQAHPYVKKALIGAGIGGLAGGILGSRNDSTLRNGIRGAALGAGLGIGYEYLKGRGVFGNNNNGYNNSYNRDNNYPGSRNQRSWW